MLALNLFKQLDYYKKDVELPPLLRAVEDNDFERTKQLIESGSDLDCTDELGRTSLHLAAAKRDNRLVKLLLANGASVDVCDVEDFDPLSYSLYVRSHELNHLMSTKYDRYYWDMCDDAIKRLFPNAPDDQLDCVHTLLLYGADINRVNKHRLSPLGIIIKNCNHSAVLRFLLSSGASVNSNRDTVYSVIRGENGSNYPKFLYRSAIVAEAQNPNGKPWEFDFSNLNGNLDRIFYERCKKELEYMKTEKIGDSAVTYYILLVGKDIGPYTRNEAVREAFKPQKSMDLQIKFPCYGDMLYQRFSNECNYQELVKVATRALCYIFQSDADAYHIMFGRIIRYLSKLDMCNLIRAVKKNKVGR